MNFNNCDLNFRISWKHFTGFAVLILMICLIYFPKCFDDQIYFFTFNKEHIYNLPLNNSSKREMLNLASITLKREDVYKFIVNQTKTNSSEYLQTLNNTLKFATFPNKILIKKISSHVKIPKELHIKYNNTVAFNGKKFALPLFTARPTGGFGNVMGEYATLYALGKLYDVPVFMQSSMKNFLKKTFPYLSMKDLPSEYSKLNCKYIGHEKDDWSKYYPIELAAAGLLGPKCFILKDYPFLPKLFNAVQNDILKEFKFSPQIILQAKNFISSIQSKAKNILGEGFFTYIGLHIRRTDYQKHMKSVGGILPGFFFIKRALDKTRKKFKNAVFIAASDDISYVKKVLSKENDIFFTEGNRRELDMAILSSCNHSIMTVGTFGFWASYLAGGEVYCANARSTVINEFTPLFYEEANLTNFIVV